MFSARYLGMQWNEVGRRTFIYARSMESEGVVGTQQRYSRATLTSYPGGGSITHLIVIDCVRTFFSCPRAFFMLPMTSIEG